MALHDLYKDIVKQLRVIRNVSRSHKEAIGKAEIDYDALTPYENGRLVRACQKISYPLWEVMDTHKQPLMSTLFVGYISGIGVNYHYFGSRKISCWTDINRELLVDDLDLMRVVMAIPHIADMLDVPLSQVPGRVMLMKLSIA